MNGMTWNEITKYTGLSKYAAQERLKNAVKRMHDIENAKYS